jgi:hypothetical protein
MAESDEELEAAEAEAEEMEPKRGSTGFKITKEGFELFKIKLDQYVRLFQDLSKRVEAAKRNLLIVGFAGLIVGQTNLVPSKIESLGIAFDRVEQANFRYIIFALIAYFLLSFRSLNQLLAKSMEDFKEVSKLGDDYEREWMGMAHEEMEHLLQHAERVRSKRFRALRGLFDSLIDERSTSLFVFIDLYLPYTVGVLGLLSILHLLPKVPT